MVDCTYKFTDAGGKERVIKGQAAFKAYLADGGLQHLMPNVAFSRVQPLTPEEVLKPSTVTKAKEAIAKYKKGEPPDPLTPKERAYGDKLMKPLFDAANRNKDEFDETLDRIAEGMNSYAKKPAVKKPYRAVTKLAMENAWDTAGMKDLLRGTIVVATPEDAQQVINEIGKVYEFDRIKNRLSIDLANDKGETVEGKPLSTGYQDVLTNVVLPDGTIAEIQISTPAMLAAKNLGHEIYAFEREMEEGPIKTKMVEIQKQIYSEGANFGRAANASNTRLNSALSTGSAFSRTSEGLRGEGVGTQAVAERQSGETVTGTSFQSKNMVSGAKESKSNFIGTSGLIIPESIGVNVNQDGENQYADKIVDGKKTLETRTSDSLRPYVGKRVAIVRTGDGPAKAIGAVTIGEPIKVTTQKQFDQYRDQTLIPKDSKFDIAPGQTKYLYPLENPVRYSDERDVGQGIVARKVMLPSRAGQKNAEASRVEGTSADRFKRTEQLQQAVADLQDGKITRPEYNRMVDELRPVQPYAAVPAVTTPKDARYALENGRGQSAEKAAKYGTPSMTLKKGDWAQLRLDIPSYQEHDAWVVSVHTPKTTNREVQSAYDAGPVVGYESVAALTDVTFGMNQKAAAKIATGSAKGTIATMLGKWSPISKADAKARADAAMNDPAWTQVGMDPFRHSYFYDRDTMRPVLSADEVIQVGPLVLAKNVKFGLDTDVTGAPIAFSSKQTETPEFKRWFGDSKVVDADGKPKVVYHGSVHGGFDVATTRKAFFTDRASTANGYADPEAYTFGESPVVQPSYLRMLNPLVVDAKGEPWMRIPYEGITVSTDYLAISARNLGHDGVIIKNVDDDIYEGDGEGTVYITMGKKAQIKSATGNTGEFGETNDIRFAQRQPMGKETEGWLLSRDELGRFRFGAGAKAYRAAADVANNVLDLVGLKPVSPELSRAMRKMRMEIDKAQNLTVEVAKNMKDLPEQERQMVSDVIEGELKRGAKPPQRVLEIAASMQDIMSEQSAELVRLGMLSPEAAGRWDGKYLPRFYEQKLGDEAKAWMKAVKGLLGRKKTMQGIGGSSLKARGMFESVPVADLADWEAEGWAVRDDAFDPAVDTEITVWRDYTRAERDDMGEIRDSMFRFVMGYNKSQRDIALGRLYENLATNYASRTEKEGYVQVPATNVEDTFAKRYGKLAGKWVPNEILDQLVAFDTTMQNDLTKIYLKGLSMWKEGKTVLNPVAHANNILSNLTTAHFAGVSYWDGHKYVGAISDLVKGNAMVDEAKEAGLFGGTFNRAELMDAMPEPLRALAQMSESKAKKSVDMIWNAMSLFLRKPLGKAYSAEDDFFRYLVYRDARNKGLEPDDAVDYALKYMFSYDDMPKGARFLRDMPLGLPFFSYTYKIVPALANTALEHPFRYAAPAVAIYTANAIMYSIAASLGGGEDEEWWTVIQRYITDPDFRQQVKDMEKQERENLPPWMKGASLSLGTEKSIRLGMDDLTNMPVFLDVSRMFPGGDLFDAHNNAGGVPLLAPITPNSPVLTIAAAMLFNKDTFRGQDIVVETDTKAEAAQKRLAWIWKQMTPAIAVGNTHFERAMNVIANVTGNPVKVGLAEYTGIGKDGVPITPGYAALQTVGIKARPIDLDTSEKIQKSQTKGLIRELDIQIKKLQRLENKGAISSDTAEAEKEKLREKKRNLRQGLTLEGEEKD
jgi:predicted transcriptional regulator